MKTIDHEFYYEFRVADDVRMIYTKKPFTSKFKRT